jgi:hypothetical protein
MNAYEGVVGAADGLRGARVSSCSNDRDGGASHCCKQKRESLL